MSACHVFPVLAVAARCSECGQPAEPAHVRMETLAVFCEAHCPSHSKPEREPEPRRGWDYPGGLEDDAYDGEVR
jgi:hypothetical protein